MIGYVIVAVLVFAVGLLIGLIFGAGIGAQHERATVVETPDTDPRLDDSRNNR